MKYYVLRGGWWYYFPDRLNSTFHLDLPDFQDFNISFRLIRRTNA